MQCGWTLFSLCAVAFVHLVKGDGCTDTKPNFRTTGLRISEEKCREFNWERKRVEKCSSDPAMIDYPYMGALGYKEEDDPSWSFLCGAFLISQKHTLTAAHCTKGRHPIGSPEIVRFGNKNIKDEVPRLDAKIHKMIVHPKFKAPIKAFDIAIVELESEIVFTKSIYPACLWSQPAFDSVGSSINPGWGKDESTGLQRTTIAEMKLNILSRPTCLGAIDSWYTRIFRELQEHHLCVNESEAGVLNCRGTAGTPLITSVSLDGNSEDRMPYAIGVSSFGRRCGDIGIYTGLPSFIDWIESIVWPVDHEGTVWPTK